MSASPKRPRPAPTPIDSGAVEHLRYIRSTIEAAHTFTTVPGKGCIAMGVTALAAVGLESIPALADHWLGIWVVAAIVACAAALWFMEQKAHGFDVWAQPMVQLRLPSLFNLRSDPFERAQHEAGDYVRWFVEHAFVLVPAQALVGQHLMSFQQFPPRQKPGSFSVEQAMEKLRNPPSSN